MAPYDSQPSTPHLSPTHSRSSSTSRQTPQQHVPTNPSQLRESHIPPSSPEQARASSSSPSASSSSLASAAHMPEFEQDGIHPTLPDAASVGPNPDATQVTGTGGGIQADVRTRLLDQNHWDRASGCGSDNCNHGTFSPRPRVGHRYNSVDTTRSEEEYGGRYEGGIVNDNGGPDNMHGNLGDAVSDGLLGGRGSKMSTTTWLAKRHGIKHPRIMYLLYYLPVTNWIRQYRWAYVRGDLIAALTMASFYLPMSLSYAANLGHIPPINGLYSFVFNPFMYAILGTCPQMVVGPEAAGSLLTGQVVRENINNGKHQDWDMTKNSQIAGMVTGLAGAVILLAGLCRLGFLDSVLSRPFLRGFISAIGIVIFVDQLIPEMGMDKIAHVSHGSSLDKIIFLGKYGSQAHGLTCAVSFGAFAIVMVCREIKRRLQPRYPSVAYVPDRFVVVVLSAVFTWRFHWDKKGLDILGDIRTKGKPFQAHFPFQPSMIEHATDAFSTAFLVALLGFFESSVAAKSLGTGTGQVTKVNKEDGEEVEEPDGIRNMTVSANRELVALGVANILGGLFMALPAFGGYGRSKVNASTGGKTPMSSVFLSLITVICILFLLPYFYYIPKGVLSAMISVVAYSLIEEAPHDLLFFWRISGYNELALMLLIFLTTFFWNLRIGIAVGIGLSLLRLLRHSTRPRIQILGRIPGTSDQFENYELNPNGLEFIPHCLIVKIPEPLTFANTGSLKDRLRRLEDHGTDNAHPALPRVRRQEHNQNVIFDVHGVTSLDPAAAQVLLEIVNAYRERGVKCYFCRVPSRRSEVWRLMCVSGIVDACDGERHFVKSVQEALDLTGDERTGYGSQNMDRAGYRNEDEGEGRSGEQEV